MKKAEPEKPKSKHEQWVEDIRQADGVSGGIALNQWEQEFLDSIEVRLDAGGTLTAGQAEKLEQIWDRI